MKWYEDPGKSELCKLFLWLVPIEEYQHRRLNNSCALQLPKYVDQFNEQGMEKSIPTTSSNDRYLIVQVLVSPGCITSGTGKIFQPMEKIYQQGTTRKETSLSMPKLWHTFLTTILSIDGEVWLRLTQGSKDD